MWSYPSQFDVIVLGAGHAGCEAAHASAKKGAKTLLLTMSLDTIGKMSCNPAIGGTAKGHIVREIDALGGIMGIIADRTAIQTKMLNASKGPAVQSPRSQNDKLAYQTEIKYFLEKTENLEIQQGTTQSFLIEGDQIKGVVTQEGVLYRANCVILCSGTFLMGLMHIGNTQISGGRGGDKASIGLSAHLESLGFKLGRLKTGTPPRINRKTINFAGLEEQVGDDGVFFSFEKCEKSLPKTSCYITYTSEQTKEIIEKNLDKSPLYQGIIKGIGPRYCPSIEDKIVRFAEKKRHQIFLEPEGLSTEEIYVNGISTSLPFDVQVQIIKSIAGLENAKIMRPAYAIEYDFITSYQVGPTLESKNIEGLFFAGQINGTTGYEEAAAQGLIAGINAANKALHKPSFILSRKEAYIGVLIDDLITKDHTEPYRMFTSRAEHRLLLRHDTADLRLSPLGYEQGLISQERYDKVIEKKRIINEEIKSLAHIFVNESDKSSSIFKLLARPDKSYEELLIAYPEKLKNFGTEINKQIELEIKYEGYIKREQKNAEKLTHLQDIYIPKNFDYKKVVGLRNETKEKLIRYSPSNLSLASHITGITPADISILIVSLQKFSSNTPD